MGLRGMTLGFFATNSADNSYFPIFVGTSASMATKVFANRWERFVLFTAMLTDSCYHGFSPVGMV